VSNLKRLGQQVWRGVIANSKMARTEIDPNYQKQQVKLVVNFRSRSSNFIHELRTCELWVASSTGTFLQNLDFEALGDLAGFNPV
jgi:hypothetical protein